MTSAFPGSPKILKGAIVSIDIFNPISSIVVFQYNPEQLSRSLDPQYGESGGDRTESLRLGGPPRETISATIMLDLTDRMEEGSDLAGEIGLYGQLSALEMMVYPKTALVATNTALLATGTIEVVPPAAPLTLFIYGWKRVVPVKMTGLSISETAHDPKLNPIRATADLTMQVLTYDDFTLIHPGYWTFLAHQAVKEGLAIVGSVDNLGAVLGEDVDVFEL